MGVMPGGPRSKQIRPLRCNAQVLQPDMRQALVVRHDRVDLHWIGPLAATPAAPKRAVKAEKIESPNVARKFDVCLSKKLPPANLARSAFAQSCSLSLVVNRLLGPGRPKSANLPSSFFSGHTAVTMSLESANFGVFYPKSAGCG